MENSMKLGPNQLIDRVEFIRLMQQALCTLGYKDLARRFETESNIDMQPPLVTTFHRSLVAGQWPKSVSILPNLPLPPASASAIHFLILEQQCLEQIKRKQVSDALDTLRTGLAPLAVTPKHTHRLHQLASILVCGSVWSQSASTDTNQQGLEAEGPVCEENVCSGERAKGALGLDENECVDDDAGEALIVCRKTLVHRIRKHLPPALLLPENRLETLVEQALQAQVRKSLFQTHSGLQMSLFNDYSAGTEHLPSTLAQTNNTAHTSEVWTLSFNAAGTLLVSGAADAHLLLWSVHNNKLHFRQRLFGHANPITFAKWHPEGLVLLSTSVDKCESTVMLHAVDTGRVLCDLPGNATRSGASWSHGEITAVCWHPTGHRFYISRLAEDRSSVLGTYTLSSVTGSWNCALIRSDPVPRINDMAILPTEHHMVAITEEHNLEVINLNNGARISRNQGHNGIGSMSLSADSSMILVMMQKHMLHLWRLVPTGGASLHDETRALSPQDAVGYNLVGVSPDDDDDSLMENGHIPLRQYSIDGNHPARYILPCCLGGTGDAFLAFSDENFHIHILHRDTGKDLQKLKGHTGTVNALAWNPTSPHMLVSASDDRSIKVWLSESALSD